MDIKKKFGTLTKEGKFNRYIIAPEESITIKSKLTEQETELWKAIIEKENNMKVASKKDKIIEVLRFYADRNNYQTPSTGFAAKYDPEPAPIKKDLGQLARNLLKEINNIYTL